MRDRIAIFFLAGFLFLGFHLAQAETGNNLKKNEFLAIGTGTVVGGNSASAKKKAITQALMKGVEDYIAHLLGSQGIVNDFERVTEEIIPGAKEEIANFHILAEHQVNGKYKVLIKLRVNEEIIGETPIDFVDERYLFNASLKPSLFHIKKLKRLFDLCFSCLGIALMSFFLPLIAIAIKINSRGPVFFRQKRRGRGGKDFSLLKFRSMHVGSEDETGAVWAQEDDKRITQVGRFLRRFRIDEWPQFFNIWKGEMSLVGPRPERPELFDELIKKIPFFHDRLAMLPGITGWAQVNYPYASTIEDSKRKLQFDLYYLKNMSPLLDFLILLRSIRILFYKFAR